MTLIWRESWAKYYDGYKDAVHISWRVQREHMRTQCDADYATCKKEVIVTKKKGAVPLITGNRFEENNL